MAERVADLMDYAFLDFSLRKDCLYGLRYAFKVVHREDKDIL